MLCALLRSTGRLGKPGEMLRAPSDVAQLASEPDPIAQLVEETSTDNGVYGLKVFSAHFELSENLRWADRLPNLHFVHVVRDDLLGQAISLCRALQTGRYKAASEGRRAPRYNRKAIEDCLARLAYGDARWRCYFARNGLAPLRLAYEEIARQPQAAVDRIASHIGMGEAPRIDRSQVGMAIQRNVLTDEWRERFLRECGNPNYLDGGLLFSRMRGGGRLARLFLGGRGRALST